MARFRVSFFLLLSLLLAAGLHAETYGAVLTGKQEVPPNTSPGFGNATVTLDAAHTSLAVSLSFSGLTGPVTGAHIHGEAAPGVATGVKIGFTPSTDFVNGQMNKSFTIDKALGDAIAARPNLYYVNIHTGQFSGGEIRGQLSTIDDVTKFSAELRSSNEVPPNNSTVVGAALITIDSTNNLTFDVSTPGIVSPTASHIHGPNGPAGTNAGVLIGLSSANNTFNNGRLRGSIQVTDAATIAALKANPSNYYVNVHTTANGGGEVRGQLTVANEYDTAVSGKVAGAADTNFVTDLRVFNPSYSARAVALVEYFQAGAAANTNATASTRVDIPPRGTAVLDDVNGASFLNAAGSTGALRVTSGSQLAVTSRVYNDQRSRGLGTFGQFVPAGTRANALRRGVLPQLSNKALDATPANRTGFRTNVGFFNPNVSTVNIRLELRDAAGVLVGQSTSDMASLTQGQASLTSYFPGVDLADRANLTLSFDASAPVFGYASIVDNVSGDSVFVSAQSDSGVSAP